MYLTKYTIKSYYCLIYGLLAFPGRLLLIFAIITCHLVEVEVSLIHSGIAIDICWCCVFLDGTGSCMGQQQAKICDSAHVSALHATTTRCRTNKDKYLS